MLASQHPLPHIFHARHQRRKGGYHHQRDKPMYITPFFFSSSHTGESNNNTKPAYTILPPRFDGGLHTAPAPQIVHFVSGAAHITLPDDSSQDLWVLGGAGGLLFATDTTGSGHITRYPSDEETVGLLAPFEGDVVPPYAVVKEGGCEGVQKFV